MQPLGAIAFAFMSRFPFPQLFPSLPNFLIRSAQHGDYEDDEGLGPAFDIRTGRRDKTVTTRREIASAKITSR